jgi:hypothetical protein
MGKGAGDDTPFLPGHVEAVVQFGAIHGRLSQG